ncbi:DUF1643 domain-containing protein [Massilia sp. TS11]|uniref:DUF1643 domain-containing protein n=1 Tax=Massilia sp. TS11 TaxID=2908003 RepID=UPI001EDA2087|nr:DUF1643 domain-containing protein [Massilia sp. TS11]MCG2582899.1 DUF1643 domain-containing protein [Massilia sp. TS11]
MKTSAVLSRCGTYRYALRRVWDPARPLVLFVCLNPSTADACNEDQTSRVCINYAKRWGFGGLLIANLFAFRSTDPAGLRSAADPVGPRNNYWIRRLQREAALTVCAWSDLGALRGRDAEVLPWLQAPHCLERLRSGRPGHPLYKKADLLPQPLFI